MSRPFEDLTGRRFGHLVAVHREESQGNHTRWLCRCDCGREKVAFASSLKNRVSQSCGCTRMYRSRSDRYAGTGWDRFDEPQFGPDVTAEQVAEMVMRRYR